eukprot:4376842-Prymnesium_polylepis.1
MASRGGFSARSHAVPRSSRHALSRSAPFTQAATSCWASASMRSKTVLGSKSLQPGRRSQRCGGILGSQGSSYTGRGSENRPCVTAGSCSARGESNSAGGTLSISSGAIESAQPR